MKLIFSFSFLKCVDCSSYLVCNHEKYVVRKCPRGLHWDNRNKLCEHPEKAQCGPRQARRNPKDTGSNYLFSVANVEYIDDGLSNDVSNEKEYEYDYYDKDEEYYDDEYEYYEDNEV